MKYEGSEFSLVLELFKSLCLLSTSNTRSLSFNPPEEENSVLGTLVLQVVTTDTGSTGFNKIHQVVYRVTMSVENGNNKAITDLGLSLNFHNRSILLNNYRGAGVNATTSKVGITFVTSHLLSELVWCPGKGISVKNSDRSEKVSGGVWGLRTNHMAVSSSKSISTKLATSDNIMDDKIDASSLCPVKFGVDEVDASGRVSRSMVMGSLVHGQDEVIKTAGSSPSLGVASGGLNAIPGNSSVVIRSQEGRSLKMAERKYDNAENFEFSAENCIEAEASKDANPEALLVDRSFQAENLLRNQIKEVYLRKGKSKALSDGDINDQISDDNMSHGSAGSCNSKVLVSSRNAKRSLDQQLMGTSKRLKQSTERDTDSFIRQSSSFMSWISNMVKRYPVRNQEDAPSSILPDMLTTHTVQENHCHKPVDHDLRGVGFRNFFQSISCSNDHVKGRKIYLDYRSSETSGDVRHSSMVDMSAVPLTAFKTTDNIPQDKGQSSKMCVQGIRSPSKQGMILSSNFSTKEIKIHSEIKHSISCNMANTMEIAKSSQSISSTDKERAQATRYSEENEAQPFGPKRDYLGSLWISRFRPKISQPDVNAITSKLTVNKRVIPNSKIIFSPGPVTSHSEGHNGFVKHEGLICSEQENVKDEQHLEVMASVFAKRLDALKQVMPYDATCKQPSMARTCLFCGVSSHDIHACSEIAEGEREELHDVIKSYDKSKDLIRLCIKCFQLSHWAFECPHRQSTKSDLGSFVDWSNDIDLYSYRRDKEPNRLLDENGLSTQPLGLQRTSEVNMRPDAEFIQLQDSGKLYLDAAADVRNPLDHVSCTQEFGESSSRPQNKISLSMADVFDAVRRLRLSRSEFLRVVDSQIPPSHLKGFYLRVRLSNRKEALGRKGYYVACIQNASTLRGLPDQAGLKTSVGVTIGSFTCLVESQYISNQDFVEDEMITWWSETAKYTRCQNRSLEELEQKYKERQRLGF